MNHKQFENQLNETLKDSMSDEDLFDKFIYLTAKNRTGGHITESRLRLVIKKGKLGSIIRKYDPTNFYSDFNSSK